MIWLDGRDQELNTTDPEGGSMALLAARFDGAGTPLGETTVNTRVCECCSTSIAVTSGGPIAAFRDRSDQEVRDIHVSRFENGAWSAPTIVHADNWRIDSCPVNGPAIAAAGSTVAVAWFAVAGDEGHAYAAFSRDGGRSFGAPIRLDDAASLGHVGIAMLDDGAAAATWVEFTGRRARLRVRRIEASGARSVPVEIAGAGAAHVSGHPRVTRVESSWCWHGPRARQRAARARTSRSASPPPRSPPSSSAFNRRRPYMKRAAAPGGAAALELLAGRKGLSRPLRRASCPSRSRPSGGAG